jgi:hypothetical protein
MIASMACTFELEQSGPNWYRIVPILVLDRSNPAGKGKGLRPEGLMARGVKGLRG